MRLRYQLSQSVVRHPRQLLGLVVLSLALVKVALDVFRLQVGWRNTSGRAKRREKEREREKERRRERGRRPHKVRN